MMKLLENTWFVGISTGIISGILVFFLTKWFMDKRGKTEYYRQVSSANTSVINALKPYISDKGLPDIDIFDALISSTARAFGVNKEDMYSVSLYCEELIREIISDVYVSNEKKQEYTKMLAEYKESIKSRKEVVFELSKAVVSSGIYGERVRNRMSMYMAVLTAFMGVICSIAMINVKETSLLENMYYPFDNNPILWIVMLFLMIILMMLIMLVTSEMLLKMMKRHRKGKENYSENENKQDKE